ncbi:adenylate/guanylate cyclase domain-containing protein [Foetidibacter luteolus]|uniref:adenylate/guanylate cyclase domain-containing protein n=1 Tax=Foetidibacter luteolus TaxID=2608880 RepID=UPI00129A2A91|nr:adenylate/guanylate cyclase domain-containing protein [Foetidibacter luteolus]
MKLSPTIRLKWKTVLVIIVCWSLLALLNDILNYLLLKTVSQLGGISKFKLGINIVLSLMIVPLAGLSGGGMIVFVLREKFRRFPLDISILLNVVIILSLIIVITFFGGLLFNSFRFSQPLWNAQVVTESINIFSSPILWYNTLFWGIVAGLTIMLLHVNEKYGQGVFFNLLVGKYYRPKEESRIFMFLDITSSTTLAEKLGHEKWFSLLNDFFNHCTGPIINSRGEIYQYVGDEVVINWKLKKGLEGQNCIKCFYAIKQLINEKGQYYEKKYGVTPGFKAAIHCGNVTVGEIGRIKKEIVFTGDTLNTCSRMLEQCRVYSADLLISHELKSLFREEGYQYEEVANLELRGRQQPVTIFKVIQPVGDKNKLFKTK